MSPEARRAHSALWAAFVVMGVGSMSWTPRIPEITEALALSATGLGVVLFLYSTGALVGAHLSGRIIHRLGTRRAATLAVSGQLASTVRPRPTPHSVQPSHMAGSPPRPASPQAVPSWSRSM